MKIPWREITFFCVCFEEFEVERCVQCVIPGGFPEQQQLLNDSIYRAEELGRPRAFRSRNSGRQMIDWDRSTGSEEALPVMHFFVFFALQPSRPFDRVPGVWRNTANGSNLLPICRRGQFCVAKRGSPVDRPDYRCDVPGWFGSQNIGDNHSRTPVLMRTRPMSTSFPIENLLICLWTFNSQCKSKKLTDCFMSNFLSF